MCTDKKKIQRPFFSSVSIGAPSVAVLFFFLFMRSVAQAAQDPKDADYLLHLPGIAGYHWVDKQMIAGLREDRFDGFLTVETHVRPKVDGTLRTLERLRRLIREVGGEA